MIKTPLGNIKVQENPDRDNPGIEILVTLPDGTEDRIALIEYQKEYNIIATYTYKEEDEDFTSKTIYKDGETTKEYTFKVKLTNEEYITVKADSFAKAVDKADYKASEMSYGNYDFWSIEEVNE